MELTPQEQKSITEVEPSTQQTFCILYWKIVDGPTAEKKVLRRINSNGVPISTKKYSEVFFYSDVRHTLVHARFLFDHGYDVKVRKCNKANNNKMWLI
jgi:uncharacterized protein YqkB